MSDLPADFVEWLRLANALTGCAAFGVLMFRLVGRWPRMSMLSRSLVIVLAGAVLVLGLGAARAAAIEATFNELGYAVLVVNLAAIAVGLIWHRWLDPTGRRT